jgi:peptide/nickel transport system substrate-binding protein
MWHAFESLFVHDAEYAPIPHLVESYTSSADGLTYRFKLREGVLFHNEQEMKSSDVVASINRFGKLATWGKNLFSVTESFEADGPYTVVLKLTEPVAMVPLYLTSTSAVIMPKDVIDEAGEGDVKRIIGTGPFEFVEYEPDRHIKFKRFEKYSALPGEPNGYGGNKTAYLDELIFVPVPDTAVRIAGVQTGDYHFGEWIAPDEYERILGMQGITPRVIKPSAWTTAVFNKQKGLMSNKLMRQAVLAALDMEPIMKAAYGHPDFWRLDSGVLFKEMAMYSSAGSEFYNQNNPERARQLAAQAGYKGEPIRWVTTTEYPAYYTSALVSASQLEKAGFNVQLDVVDWATVVQKRGDPDAYDLFSTAFGTIFDPVLFLGFSSTWPGWYESEEKDALVAALRRESDFDKRMELWDELQALFWEDVPVIKYGDYFLLHIHRNEAKGFQGMATSFYWNVWLEP